MRRDADGVVRNERVSPLVRVRVRNIGNKGAGLTTLRVYVPDRHLPMAWCDGDGHLRAGAARPSMSVRLQGADGRQWPARMLLESIGDLARGGHHDEFFGFTLDGLEVGETQVAPRAPAHSDALGADPSPVTLDHQPTIERLAGSDCEPA